MIALTPLDPNPCLGKHTKTGSSSAPNFSLNSLFCVSFNRVAIALYECSNALIRTPFRWCSGFNEELAPPPNVTFFTPSRATVCRAWRMVASMVPLGAPGKSSEYLTW